MTSNGINNRKYLQFYMANSKPFEEILKIPKEGIPRRIYQMQIKLMDIRPPIWRRILICSHSYFSELHEVIQRCFSWVGYHLHEFYFQPSSIGGALIYIKGVTEMEMYEDLSESYHFQSDEIRLCDVFSETQKRAYYVYDFGDHWEHLLLLEKIFPFKSEFREPLCVDGRRAAPPDDSGGPFGYQDLLEILKDPSHKEYEYMLDWVGGEFNPNQVDEIDIKMSPKAIEKSFGPPILETK